MGGLVDANWVKALSLPLRVTSGVLIACIGVLGLDSRGVISLEEFGRLARPTVIIVGVLAGGLVFAGMCGVIADEIAKQRERWRERERARSETERDEAERAAKREAVLARIDYLSPGELRLLAECLREEKQSFFTYVHSSDAATLQGKGLVYCPGGVFNEDRCPFTIRDYVWVALVERKEEILRKDDERPREGVRPKTGGW